MMLKVLASEEENVRTLNYAPGPLPTDMVNSASKNTKDSDLKKWFEGKVILTLVWLDRDLLGNHYRCSLYKVVVFC